MSTADGQPQVRTDATDALDSAVAGPSTWSLDAAHSSAAFRHKTIWGLVTVHGTFSDLAGRAEILPDGSARGRLDIGAASLNTKKAKRDKHLKSAELLNAETHPRIIWHARRARRGGGAGHPAARLHRHRGGSHRRCGHPPRRGRGGPGEFRHDLEPDGHAARPRCRHCRGPVHPVRRGAGPLTTGLRTPPRPRSV